ncbi:hypothetical protein HRR83_005789 [Exophiala dermatitidis]|uniref:Uncharacterized protein n=2 Tax=Exophiala dermatitidis TaxID=5970 RepID=H6BUY3_EXODN|nr:uncharacterized protein HMPREF1120_03112 [Exophiala dermatitidis NIH/UT8656]KAJ4508697.1 hypothetical protein HRR73_007364 [Exophiala dermatitidis]EHY54953.1 hypothetical protein HMPREF1120_03112 [Exophiala dermatitidis NIH/UT8656]KAJ4510948.1 hypothetical protein HRR75_005642 [Exophiala dermatitidis]KAJ4513345.1 hypothetical protein HRR74_006157 [Exophiala dermatitidis]KAJ4538103.1 hypothetical protein HRR77_007143 [Exophiala dermatitidis]
MFDTTKPHPLLAQVPLTVSPFLSIPTAVTLPYTFRSVPTSLPPSIVPDNGPEKPKYVVASSGHSAHPDDIIASCKALQDHLRKTAEAAEKAIREWEEDIKARDLAEKRRVAPGWLDREEKILEPTKATNDRGPGHDLLDGQSETVISAPAMSPSREGEELDRAFGNLGVK